MVAGLASAQAPEEAAKRFVLAYVSYAPESSVDVRVDARVTTPMGPYVVATARRSSLRGGEPEQLSLLIDPQSRQVTVGPLMPLPPTNPPLSASTMPGFVETVLTPLLSGAMGSRVRIRWPSTPTRTTAVVTLAAEIASGYGWVRMPAAITMDGKYFMLGSTWPLDRDRERREEMLRDARVSWDQARVRGGPLVEFSDFQCPACKPLGDSQEVLDKIGSSVRHGMVNYPHQSHPWAFAAAVAGSASAIWPDHFWV